jgi:predicted Zn-dependent protease
VPSQVSGRRRFNIISPQLEAYLAEGTEEEIKREYRGKFLPEWDPRARKVQTVLERLLPFVKEAGLGEVGWEVHVIESPEQNAFVIPGYVRAFLGWICVGIGIPC